MDQQPPPPLDMTQQAYTAHSGHGSVGPVIAVLAVISVLGVIAGIVGRLCSGRPVMGVREYDFERWIETKCSSCIDGRVGPPPHRPPPPEAVAASSVEEVTAPAQVETSNEIKEEQQSQAKSQADSLVSS